MKLAVALLVTALAQGFTPAASERPRVLSAADAYLHRAPQTITAFRASRSAGGVHDFFSEGDYWWPDPAKPDGPYIRRDGESNPANFVEHRRAMVRLSIEVPALAAAWLLTKEVRYAEQARRHLRAWFVEPETRMFWKRATGHGAFAGLIAGTAAAALHHGLTLPAGAVAGVKGGWIAITATYPSEMAQNFWTAINAFMMVIALPLAFLVDDRSKDAATPTSAGPDRHAPPAPRLGAILRQPAFYLLAIGSMCSIAAVGGTNQHLKLFLSLDRAYSQTDAASIISLVLAISIAGRLFMPFWLSVSFATGSSSEGCITPEHHQAGPVRASAPARVRRPV